MDNNYIIQKIKKMYIDYGVNVDFLDALDDERKIKGMKGVLAELDIKKKHDYTPEDSKFIRKIYSMFC